MAGRAGLIRPGLAALAGLALLVLIAHLATLRWVGGMLGGNPRIQEMADPMLTRVLQPAKPPAPPAAPPAPMPRPRPKKVAVAAAPAASQPREAEPEPQAQAQAAQEAPAEPAKAEPEPPPTAAAPAPSAPDAATPAQATAAAAPASAPGPGLDSWPADTRVSYRLFGNYRGDVHGRGQVQWQRQQDRYQVRVDVDVAVLLRFSLISQGQVTAQGLVPAAFEEQRPGGARTVLLGEDGIRLNDGRMLPRPEGVQDAASQFAELSHRFSTGQEKLEVGRTVQLWLARPGGVDAWTYDIVEKEMVETPELGAVEAFRLKPRPLDRPRGNISAEIWYAPALQYLPVKVRIRMGDEAWLELTVLRIEQGGAPR